MPNKKTVRRNKRNSKRSRGRNRKGGFFGLFEDKHNTGNAACDPNNLANLKDSNSMHSNYQTCCPKSWYGRKNNSPYCKKLDLNYKAAFQSRQNEANLNKQAITSTFTRDSDNGLTVDVQIDCKNPNLYNTEEEIQKYIEACECNKTRWNPFSEKKTNCAIIKPKLERVKQEKEEQERPTEVFNPIQQNNQYMPVNQNDNENYNDNENEAEAQERPTEVTNPYQKNEYVQPQEDQNQRPSLYSPDNDIPPPPPVNAEGATPVNAEGGKRRKTKKHFRKRSIRKRSIRKRSIRKRSIRKRKGRKH
jgi:hypothetical protein